MHPSRLAAPARPTLSRPRAVLLDFGGVIFETSKHPDGRENMATWMAAQLSRAGFDYSSDRLRTSLDAGLTALKAWKNSSSRRLAPQELTHREIIIDFIASDLPAGPRELLASRAPELLKTMNTTISGHTVRPGIPELLAWCRAHDVPLGIVSNAHSGASHRELLAEHGLDDDFAVQIYSDEVGIRKPHPGMLQLAADALAVPIEECWYVGDTQDRDLVAGRRAGAGAVLITRCHHTDSPPFAVAELADAVLDTPAGLVDLLTDAARSAGNDATTSGTSTISRSPSCGRALLIDHGGVIAISAPDPQAHAEFVAQLAELVGTGDEQADLAHAEAVLAAAKSQYSAGKNHRRDLWQRHEASALGFPVLPTDVLRDVSPREFWHIENADARTNALLRSESIALMAQWGRAKSRRTLRPGVRELFDRCAADGIPIVVVSNTVSGTGVRANLEAHGLLDQVRAVLASDEFGVRKPHPSIAAAGLAIAQSDPARTWFLGDKPQNDAEAAKAVGIAHRVLVRGGASDDATLQAALDSGLATDLIDVPGDLNRLFDDSDTAPHPAPRTISS